MAQIPRFTIDPGTYTFPAEAYGLHWNGFLTPHVTADTLTNLLGALEEPYARHGTDVHVWDRLEYGTTEPDDVDNLTILAPDSHGVYNLGPLGFAWSPAEEFTQASGAALGTPTPLGRATRVRDVAIGISQITAAYGTGFLLSEERNARIPARQSNPGRWYDQWSYDAAVVATFPSEFAEDITRATGVFTSCRDVRLRARRVAATHGAPDPLDPSWPKGKQPAKPVAPTTSATPPGPGN